MLSAIAILAITSVGLLYILGNTKYIKYLMLLVILTIISNFIIHSYLLVQDNEPSFSSPQINTDSVWIVLAVLIFSIWGWWKLRNGLKKHEIRQREIEVQKRRSMGSEARRVQPLPPNENHGPWE